MYDVKREKYTNIHLTQEAAEKFLPFLKFEHFICTSATLHFNRYAYYIKSLRKWDKWPLYT